MMTSMGASLFIVTAAGGVNRMFSAQPLKIKLVELRFSVTKIPSPAEIKGLTNLVAE